MSAAAAAIVACATVVVTAAIYLSTLVTGLAGLVLPRVDAAGAGFIALQSGTLLALVALLELAGRRPR